MVKNIISWNEMYPFDFESKEATVDVTLQNTADEGAKSPDEEVTTSNKQSAGGFGSFSKNKLYVIIAVVVGIMALMHVGVLK